MKRISTLPYLCILAFSTGFFLTSCKDEEEQPKTEVEFTTTAGETDEGDTIEVHLTLKPPAAKTEYITISVTSSNASFGVDYGIDNLLELKENFTIKVSKDCGCASFSVIALEDFETESDETVKFEIDEMSVGLIPGSNKTFTVTINDVANYKVSNRAILFDGVDDYIDLGNIYDNVTLPLTISAWIWLDPTAPSGSIPIFDSQDGLPMYNGFNFMTSTASIAGIQYGDGLGENNSVYRRAKSATFSPVAGRWVNFTAVMKAATDMSIYFNGVDVGGNYAGESDQPMYSNSPTEVAKIGYLFQNGVVYRFKGKIDELKIWNRALPLAEIQKTIFTKSPSTELGLIGYWNFDEATAETVLDHSSNHFNGVIKGNATRVLSEVPIH
jgi:hypothetical protein